MTRNLVTLIALFALAACDTVAGAGKDISSGGHWITNQANEDR